jgi:hypothetical protein
MTRLKHWILVAVWLVLLTVLVLQARSISQLRRENQSLRAQSQSAPTDASTPPPAETIDTEQLQKDRLELLRLRNEVRQLREQTFSPANGAAPVASQPAPLVAPATQPIGDAQQFALAAMQGDSSALDNLANLAAAVRTTKPEDRAAVVSSIQSAFELLGKQAGTNNAGALQALWQASRVKELQGFAVRGLGEAAGLGNEEALKPLLDPESYLLLRSSTTAALKPAADAGNQRAIQALAATAADPKQQGLWLLAAQGLETAAGTGNATAIDGLATLAATPNQVISRQAVLALEAAARKNQPRAEEALRKLGWR